MERHGAVKTMGTNVRKITPLLEPNFYHPHKNRIAAGLLPFTPLSIQCTLTTSCLITAIF
jgi:hypothetical protein